MSSGALYHISQKKAKKSNGRIHVKWLLLPLLLLLLILILNFQFFPLLSAIASTEAERRIEDLIGSAITEQLTKSPFYYSDIITLRYKEDGSVSSLSADTARLIAVRTELLKCILTYLNAKDHLRVVVPVASVLGINFFPSAPVIDVDLRISEGVNAYFVSHFEEQGINQTRHSICFYLTLDILVLVPSDTQKIKVSREFPFAETVIVGNVPDAYTKISRLTDDITESEIDDIYDFGASPN